MARHIVQTLTDDVDGSSPATETISFGLDGELFVIDVNAEHALQLRESLRPFLGYARRTGGRLSPLSNTLSARAVQAKARDNRVRAWARGVGVQVGDREAISTDLWIRFQEAGA